MTKQKGDVLWVSVDEKSILKVNEVIPDSNVDFRGNLGQTPLHRAAIRLFPEAIKVLIQHGANVNLVDDNGQTALHCVKPGDVESVACMDLLCVMGADVNAINNRGMTPLHTNTLRTSKRSWYTSDLLYLIRAGSHIEMTDNRGRTPLTITAEHGCSHVAQALLQHGADPNTRDELGNTPLFLNTINTNPSVDYVKLLLRYNANVNARNHVCDTPLHRACAQNRPVLGWVKALLNAGADVHAKNCNGDTPLHMASLVRWTEIVSLLLDHGADTRIINHLGYTPCNQPSFPSPCGCYQDGGTSVANAHIMDIETQRRDMCMAFAVGYDRHKIPPEHIQKILDEAGLNRDDL